MTYEEAQAAVHANPDDAGAWFVLGALEEAAGNAAQATASYRLALWLDPFMQEAHAALTRLSEERVLTRARGSLAQRDDEPAPASAPPPVLPTDRGARPTLRRWPLLALLLLSVGLTALLYRTLGAPAVTPTNPTTIGDNSVMLIASVTTETEREAQSGADGEGTTATPRSPEVTAVPSVTLAASGPAPTTTPTTTPTPTPTVVSAGALLERVAAAEAELRSGQFQATTRLSADTHSSAQVRFDLGRGGEGPRFHLITTYDGPESSQITEYVIIGEQAWQRVERQAWVELVEQEGVWGRIHRYLPQHEGVTDAVVQIDGERAELRWRDSNSQLEVTLWLDVTSAIPLELQVEQTEGGTVTIVQYEAWNTPVEIEPPS